MKVSFAVALLISQSSAHHQKSRHHTRRLYPDTAAGNQWWELNNPNERIHNSGNHGEDELSAHDTDVVDAPEDMHRVGNDHELLHNGKLAPNGYYNGFYHKDAQGNYAQRSDTNLIQLNGSATYDHNQDTDDIPEGQDPIMVQRTGTLQKMNEKEAWNNYFQDSGSIVKRNQQIDEQDWDKTYEQEEDAKSFEFVQTKYEHENDTEDLPENFDQYKDYHRKRGAPFFKPTKQDLLDEKEDVRIQQDSEEVQALMDQQSKEVVNLQILDIPHEDDTEDIAVEFTPDFYDHNHSKQYNLAVERQANKLEAEIKRQDRIEEQQEKTEQEAKDTERLAAAKAEIEAQQEEIAERKELERQAKPPVSKAISQKNEDVDLSEIYGNMVDDSNIQLEDNGLYQHHTDFWYNQMDIAAENLDKKMNRVEAQQIQDNSHHATIDTNELYNGLAIQTVQDNLYQHHSDFWDNQMNVAAQNLDKKMLKVEEQEKEDNSHHATININQLYNGMALQTGQFHSDAWYERIDAQANEMEKEDAQYEKQQQENLAQSETREQAIKKFGMTPEVEEVQMHHKNPDLDLIYNNLAESKYDHENDTDDIVPELGPPSAPILVKQKNKK